jgi:monoamine oxidase
VKVCVVEARDRVGGRTLDRPIGGGHVVEGGGQWACPTQTAVLGLAKELGIETFNTHTKGKTVVHIGGTRFAVPGGEGGSRDLRRVKEKLDTLAKEVPLARRFRPELFKQLQNFRMKITVAASEPLGAGARS